MKTIFCVKPVSEKAGYQICAFRVFSHNGVKNRCDSFRHSYTGHYKNPISDVIKKEMDEHISYLIKHYKKTGQVSQVHGG